jgi:hypothetical protein
MPRTVGQSFVSVYCGHSMSILPIFWYGYVKCVILYKGDGLRLMSVLSWEVALNMALTHVGLGRNTGDRKTNSAEACATNDKTVRWILSGC